MLTAIQNEDRYESGSDRVSLDDILFQAGELAALPQVILKLIDLTADPKVSAADVERVIQTDHGTTARVLALANSSYYGLPRRISSVREAVVFLGFKSVRSLAMAVTAFNMFLGKSDRASVARRDLWRHSLNTALCTRVIYKWLHPNEAKLVDQEVLFTAALLHDMGKMALEIALPDRYGAAVLAANEVGIRLHQNELEFLPFSHAVIGSAMADRWSLPDVLCDIVLNHHTPLDSQISLPATAVVSMADELAQGCFEQYLRHEETDVQSGSLGDSAAILRFGDETLRAVNEACKLEMDKGIALSSF